jgi:hypothetical protein
MARLLSTILILFAFAAEASAQTLSSSSVQIEWKVTNRFRLFADTDTFSAHEIAWRQYLQHVDGRNLDEDAEAKLIRATSVIGTEHVLNDRFIPFTEILRTKYDKRGWAARHLDNTCWDQKTRTHSKCGGVEAYIEPKFHEVKVWLKQLVKTPLLSEMNCEWRVGDGAANIVPCDEAALLQIPFPTGATISVNVEGEQPISTEVAIKDLLIVGMGDSFASGEGNPDRPVEMSTEGRHRTYYPKRAKNDVTGNAAWLDELCHRSLYSHQLRAALQIAIENPKAAVTFMGYACSGAAVEAGVLGPQEWVDYVGTDNNDGTVSAKTARGSDKQNQFFWLMRELCRNKPDKSGGLWTCPDRAFRRNIDFVLLSIGGNDIGFSNLVGWATLRSGASASLAKFFGATVKPSRFADNMRDVLPSAYGKLAKAIEAALPIAQSEAGFDATRVVLTAYPDILADEKGNVCKGGDDPELPSNQSLTYFASWLNIDDSKINSAHAQLGALHKRMGELAEDHGWHFAGRTYEDRPFQGHGFCAQNQLRITDPAEQLIIPCLGKSKSPTADCSLSLSGKQREWRPYNPSTDSFPYALRQRWVRTFNDAYMVINSKVAGRSGKIDDRASATVFSETIGAMHPTAEGHAAMADAILLDIRDDVARALGSQ